MVGAETERCLCRGNQSAERTRIVKKGRLWHLSERKTVASVALLPLGRLNQKCLVMCLVNGGGIANNGDDLSARGQDGTGVGGGRGLESVVSVSMEDNSTCFFTKARFLRKNQCSVS